MTHKILITDLSEQFTLASNPSNANQMEAYMKHHFKFFGVKSPERKAIQQPWISEIQKSCSADEKWEIVFALWVKDEREFQLVAMDLLNRFKNRDFKKKDIQKLEMLIATKSWWDSVDTIASNALGVYFQQFPEQQKLITENWSESGNIWLMRCCLIFQLKYKNDVDFDLLTTYIRKFKSNNEFFIQKAIGWSLRQYSKYNAEAVREFLSEEKLSNLATREAKKYL